MRAFPATCELKKLTGSGWSDPDFPDSGPKAHTLGD